MNILFISLGEFNNIADGSVHIDLMKRFATEHDVYLICKREKRECADTELSEEYGIHILRVRTGNIKDTNIIEKGISTLMIEPQFTKAAQQYFSDIKFDLVIYTTPPITFVKVVKTIKKRDNATTYLLLKDIFPQNAVDIGLIKKKGLGKLLFFFFRRKEKKLYGVSDYIGCMSPKNCTYLLENNPEIEKTHVEVCPNCIDVIDKSVSKATRHSIRLKYGIPIDKTVFVYGGNLGKPQGIPFLIECLDRCKDLKDVFFLIVGDGTEYSFVSDSIAAKHLWNTRLMRNMQKSDYESLVGACDVGLIFLDYRFTIPNFPSRVLSYMQAKLPIIACTDNNTDFGEIIENGDFGWWCPSNDAGEFHKTIQRIITSDLAPAGNRAFKYLSENWDVSKQYEIIMRTICKHNTEASRI